MARQLVQTYPPQPEPPKRRVNRFLRAIEDRVALTRDYEIDWRLKARQEIKRQTDRRRDRLRLEQELRDRQYRAEAKKAYIENQRSFGREPCPLCERFIPASEIVAHIAGCQEWPQGS